MDLSVIIPVHNKGLMLSHCIQSIMSQEDANEARVELIIIFDACTDDSLSRAEKSGVASVFPTRFIETDKRNPAQVRNVGAATAKGETLLFLDPDVILPACHFRALREAMNAEEVTIALTPIFANAVSHWMLPLLLPLPPDWETWDNLRLLEWSGAQRELEDIRLAQADPATGILDVPYPWVFGWSSGMGVPRDLFERLGGFNTDFCGKGSEDLVFSRELWRNGARFRLLLDAKAFHWPHHRARIEEICVDRIHEARLLRTSPEPDIELLCAFDGEAVNPMARLLSRILNGAARQWLLDAFRVTPDIRKLGLNRDIGLTIGLPPCILPGAAQGTFYPPIDGSAHESCLPLYGFALPFQDSSLDTVVLGGLYELLPGRLQMRQINEAGRVAKRVILLRPRNRHGCPQADMTLSQAAAIHDNPYWEIASPIRRDPWLFRAEPCGSDELYITYDVFPVVSPPPVNNEGLWGPSPEL